MCFMYEQNKYQYNIVNGVLINFKQLLLKRMPTYKNYTPPLHRTNEIKLKKRQKTNAPQTSSSPNQRTEGCPSRNQLVA